MTGVEVAPIKLLDSLGHASGQRPVTGRKIGLSGVALEQRRHVVGHGGAGHDGVATRFESPSTQFKIGVRAITHHRRVRRQAPGLYQLDHFRPGHTVPPGLPGSTHDRCNEMPIRLTSEAITALARVLRNNASE